jgi:hypothetical protein
VKKRKNWGAAQPPSTWASRFIVPFGLSDQRPTGFSTSLFYSYSAAASAVVLARLRLTSPLSFSQKEEAESVSDVC